MPIPITRRISIPDEELDYQFTKSSGPGGQHVNKAETAVRLFFDVAGSPSLSQAVKDRLSKLAGNRMTDDGTLILECQESRSQHRNRELVTERFIELVQMAARPPRKRKKTKPSRGAKERRLKAKKKQSEKKKRRRGDLD